MLKTADMIDQVGAKGAPKKISMIKVIAPMGVSPDTPLADFYTGGRVLRVADGPDEVHLQTIAKLELKDSGNRRMDITAYLTPRQ